MAQNPSKTHKKNPSISTLLPHSRSISTFRTCQNIRFMPKFLLKLLNKKKSHKRSKSNIKADVNLKEIGVGKAETKDFMHEGKKNYLLKLLPTPKRISSLVSKKVSDHKTSDQNHKIVKVIDPGFSWSQASSSSTKGRLGKYEFSSRSNGSNEHSVKREQARGGKYGKIKVVVERKGGLRIKGFMKKVKRKEKEEKRFELCKKKILMGEKCRPLNGKLRYDQNGILVAEDLPG